MSDIEEKSVDKRDVRPSWYTYINLFIALIAPAVTLLSIVFVLIFADERITLSDAEEGYLQSAIPTPQLFILGIFTYCGVVVSLALFRSVVTSSLVSIGRSVKSVAKIMPPVTDRMTEMDEKIDGVERRVDETRQQTKDISQQIKEMNQQIKEIGETDKQ